MKLSAKDKLRALHVLHQSGKISDELMQRTLDKFEGETHHAHLSSSSAPTRPMEVGFAAGNPEKIRAMEKAKEPPLLDDQSLMLCAQIDATGGIVAWAERRKTLPADRKEFDIVKEEKVLPIDPSLVYPDVSESA